MDKNKQTPVFAVNGSLNTKYAITINTDVPTPKPINRLGHIAPPKYSTKYLTDIVNKYDIGMPHNIINHV